MVYSGQVAPVGYNGATAGVYCRSGLEIRNHLYFECAFTKSIWKEAMRCYLISRPELDGRKLLGFSHFDV